MLLGVCSVYSTRFAALMVVLALTSISAGIFDVKHELHLQLVPHISKHHQVRPRTSTVTNQLTVRTYSIGDSLRTILHVLLQATCS